MIKLDYTLESPEDRKALVEQILAEEQESITPAYLEKLADYLILCMEKQERKEKKILTDNRMATVNKRECSFEGLAASFENGEDGVYNLMSDNNKNCLFKPKISITEHDIETVPGLKQLREAIQQWEQALKRASGRDAFTIKKALIEMRKEQYILKQAYQCPIIFKKIIRNAFTGGVKLDDTSEVFWDYENPENEKNGELKISGISLMNPDIISAVLCNYSRLKEDSYGKFEGDTWYFMESFDAICTKALENDPYYERLVELKIDGMQNNQIQQALEQEFGIRHSPEYISSLWRNKIPKMIAAAATEDYLTWFYRTNGLPMKKCSKCGQFKPAHNVFFSRNKTSKDKLYSICKCCRNKKKGG